MNEIIGSLQKEHDVKMGLDSVSGSLAKVGPASPWAACATTRICVKWISPMMLVREGGAPW
jgi:hypothetical protein